MFDVIREFFSRPVGLGRYLVDSQKRDSAADRGNDGMTNWTPTIKLMSSSLRIRMRLGIRGRPLYSSRDTSG